MKMVKELTDYIEKIKRLQNSCKEQQYVQFFHDIADNLALQRNRLNVATYSKDVAAQIDKVFAEKSK